MFQALRGRYGDREVRAAQKGIGGGSGGPRALLSGARASCPDLNSVTAGGFPPHAGAVDSAEDAAVLLAVRAVVCPPLGRAGAGPLAPTGGRDRAAWHQRRVPERRFLSRG